MFKTDLIVILGCTATGKTALAAHLAHKINGEVISADSRQVYRGMDVGTGKDLSEYTINGNRVLCHLIDILDAGEEYNVFEYQKDFLTVYEEVRSRNHQPILCGGTGLYLEAVLKGYRFLQIDENRELREELDTKPVEELVQLLSKYKTLHNTTDSVDKNRVIRAIEIAKFEKENEVLIKDFPKIDHVIFGIDFDRETIKKRITERLKVRLEKEEMIEEVNGLINAGVDPEKLKFYGLEYKLITRFLLNEIHKNDMFQQLNSAIHQFAKRQATWYRKMHREGFHINWIDGNLSLEDKLKYIEKKLSE